jgi:S-adenosylmethionine:tRNA ribosyltransferase-isomerase
VAAPTAALHFDEGVLAALAARAWRGPSRCTWAPAPSSRCGWRRSPTTRCTASGARCRPNGQRIAATRAAGGRIVAVGTTTCARWSRALAAHQAGTGAAAGPRETDIFITPGFEFRVVDRC